MNKQKVIIALFAALIVVVAAANSAQLDVYSSKTVAVGIRFVRSTFSSRPSVAEAAATAPVAKTEAGTYLDIANASDYPADFTPYASTSIWNTRVSAKPALLSNSAAIVAAQFPGGRNPAPVRANEAGQFDYNHPRFFAKMTDPVIAVTCTQYCGAPDNGGTPASIHIPSVAHAAGGNDSHLDVVQPDGTEIMMWGANSAQAKSRSGNWSSGQRLSALNVANCGNIKTSQGWLKTGPAPTAAGYCLNAGIVTAAELVAGKIDHAIFIVGNCAVGTQYPVQNDASTTQCTSGVGPPLGGREWYDVPCAKTQADATLHPWEKAVLCALNVYGGYFGDNSGGGAHFVGGVTPQLESEEPWYDFNGVGYVSPFAALGAQGWYSIRIPQATGSVAGKRWIGADPWNPAGVDFAAHIHWLAACSAHGAC
jgi:hypothetical protein